MKKTVRILLSLITVFSLLVCLQFTAVAELTGPTIKTQPQSISVNYPDSAEFKVVPDDADKVASYQWYYVDYVGQIFKLEGISAKTDTLIVPSTDKYYDGNYFYCVLTGKNGKTTKSNNAYVTVDNYFEDMKLLLINNYAIKRGETLDLSKTELGTGKITYASDGKSVTLDNVYMDNEKVILDRTISASLGIMLDDKSTEIDRLDIKLIGKNTVINKFYQESTNGSGITLDFYFTGLESSAIPDVHISGSGELTVIGGSIELRTNGNLYLDAPVSFKANGDYFCDAVNGSNVTVSENVPLNFDVNGTLIYAKKGINIKNGAKINAKTSAPFVMNDYTYKNGFLCTYDINIKDASVNIELAADPDRFIPNGTAIAGFLGMSNKGKVILDGSDVTITQRAGKANDPYFFGGGGIYCDELELNNSTLKIDVNSDDIIDTYGISAAKNITVNKSTLDCFVHTSGRVFGIAANGDLKIEDSSVSSNTASADESAYGIMYKTVDIDLKSYDQRVESTVNNGFAMGANAGNGQEIKGFENDYQITASKLGEHTVFLTPEDAVFNRASMEKSTPGSYIYLETVYSAKDTENASKHIVIGCDLPKPPKPSPDKKEDKPSNKTSSTEKLSPLTKDGFPYIYSVLLLVSSVSFAALFVYNKKRI
ncbi:MAG: hypothetical protein MJ080_05215 [Clostridia bacterium]|nr:hypothetical protein [Clostridia bacterium]